MNKSKPNAFTGYLLGLFVVLLIVGIMRFQTIISLAHDIFAPRYEAADELISHGTDSLKTSVPAYFVHEDADAFTCLMVNYAGKNKLNCAPEDILIAGTTEGEKDVERTGGRNYDLRTDALTDFLKKSTIRDNAVYHIQNYNGEYNCYLFDFPITKETFLTICDTAYFMDILLPQDSGQNGIGTIAIDVYGNVCFIGYEQENVYSQTNEKFTIGFTR